MSLPSDYVVFTRDIDSGDPNLAAYGLTKDGMLSLMRERSIYLNGWDRDVNHEIIVTVADNTLEDFNLYSDALLETMATAIDDEYKSIGITVLRTELYKHSQAKFIKVYMSQPNGSATVYGLQYYTVYNGKAINITMQSYSGQLTSAQESIHKSIVDSVRFDTAPQISDTHQTPSSAFTYSDSMTKASFTVPANWVEAPLSAERETIDAKFTHLSDSGMCIMYGSMDVWSEMTATERSLYDRADVDNGMFTREDVADSFGLSGSDVHMETYGKHEFFVAAQTSDTSAYGLNVSVTITYAMLVENGYMYVFQFSGTSDSEQYSDFEALLSSLKLPSAASASGASGAAGASDKTGAGTIGQFDFASLLLSLLITVAVYSLPIMIYRYAVRKSPVPAKQAKKIAVIYGICAFVVMLVILVAVNGGGAPGGAILLWSWINYLILTGGKDKRGKAALASGAPAEPSAAYDYTQAENAEPPRAESPYRQAGNVCQACGAAASDESRFCHNCGAKLTRNGETE